MRHLAALIAALAACADPDPPLPACADLGCVAAPSGSPLAWEPCPDEAEVCWCAIPVDGAPVALECVP